MERATDNLKSNLDYDKDGQKILITILALRHGHFDFRLDFTVDRFHLLYLNGGLGS
jgi:hypothetical protein